MSNYLKNLEDLDELIRLVFVDYADLDEFRGHQFEIGLTFERFDQICKWTGKAIEGHNQFCNADFMVYKEIKFYRGDWMCPKGIADGEYLPDLVRTGTRGQ